MDEHIEIKVYKFPAPREVDRELYPLIRATNSCSGMVVSGPSQGRQVSIRGFGMIPKFRAWVSGPSRGYFSFSQLRM